MKGLKKYLPDALKKKIKTLLYGEIHGGLRPFFKNVSLFEPYIKENQTVIEIGSERDAGSSYYMAKFCEKHNLNFITIDPNKETSEAVQKTLLKFNNEKFKAVNEKGEVYLSSYDKGDIFFAYLDGFDVIIPGHPHKKTTIEAYEREGINLLKDGNEISAKVHLDTALFVEKYLVDGGVIGFDDSWYENDEWHGKGKTAIPYFLNKGYTLINSREKEGISRSIILQKTTKN